MAVMLGVVFLRLVSFSIGVEEKERVNSGCLFFFMFPVERSSQKEIAPICSNIEAFYCASRLS